MNELTIRMARRAVIDPRFLAFALHEYAEREGWDEPALLAALGATPETLASARLCRMPRADPPAFKEDVDRIAATFHLNRDALAAMARHGQVTAAVRAEEGAVPTESAAPLLAARDKTE